MTIWRKPNMALDLHIGDKREFRLGIQVEFGFEIFFNFMALVYPKLKKNVNILLIEFDKCTQ